MIILVWVLLGIIEVAAVFLLAKSQEMVVIGLCIIAFVNAFGGVKLMLRPTKEKRYPPLCLDFAGWHYGKDWDGVMNDLKPIVEKTGGTIEWKAGAAIVFNSREPQQVIKQAYRVASKHGVTLESFTNLP